MKKQPSLSMLKQSHTDDTTALAVMPKPTPLAMPTQNLNTRFWKVEQNKAHKPVKTPWAARFSVFIPAITTTIALLFVLLDWFEEDGFSTLETIMLVLASLSSFWIALSVSTSTLGIFHNDEGQEGASLSQTNGMDVALLVPIYNEDPKAVFQRIRTMRNALTFIHTNHRFAFFILSDSQDTAIAKAEEEAFGNLGEINADTVPVFYRRRAENIERKTGNIRQWIENWGNAWDAFITLDADSLMGANIITELANRMAADERMGLLQTVPKLMGAQTLFSRVQQFANNAHGGILARGLERISGPDGNYWGHNAIIRTKAFAATAGLPRLSGYGPLSGTIKSHDFVEAALLRRAGWTVKIWPQAEESYEEVPQNMVDYILRDRRWCQGNLQHLRLLSTSGFTLMSRFHMFQGAMAYILSVVWFALLLLWTLMGRNAEQNVFRYFTDTNPLFPQWPQMDVVSRVVVLGFVIALLLTPKIFSMATQLWQDPRCKAYGGAMRFLSHCLLEIALSVLLAPIMMIQHVVAVMRTLIGFDAGWAPQNRAGTQYSLFTLARFHKWEMLAGIALTTGISMGIVTPWLIPIAASLTMAIPISYLSGLSLPHNGRLAYMMEGPKSQTSIINAAAKQQHQPIEPAAMAASQEAM